MSYLVGLTPRTRRIHKQHWNDRKYLTSPRKSHKKTEEFPKIAVKFRFQDSFVRKTPANNPKPHLYEDYTPTFQYFQSYNPYVLGSVNSLAFRICCPIQTTAASMTYSKSKKTLPDSISLPAVIALAPDASPNIVSVLQRAMLVALCVGARGA